MTKQARTYVVRVLDQNDAQSVSVERLVDATYSHMAERHVIGGLVHAHVATKADLKRLMSKGVRIEDATGEPDPSEKGKADDDATFASLPPIP